MSGVCCRWATPSSKRRTWGSADPAQWLDLGAKDFSIVASGRKMARQTRRYTRKKRPQGSEDSALRYRGGVRAYGVKAAARPPHSIKRFPSLTPLPLGFSQVFILKELKVVCFHTLLQVLILNVVSQDQCGAVWRLAFRKRRFAILQIG